MAIVKDEGKVYWLFDDGTEFWVHCVNELTPNYTSEATSLEVEEGGESSDHIRPNPVEISLTGFFSELEGQENNDAYDPQFQGDHTAFHERMLQAWQSGETISIDARLIRGLYADVAILNYSCPFTVEEGLSLNFTFQGRVIRYAELKKTSLTPSQSVVNKNNVENSTYIQYSGVRDYGTIQPTTPSAKLDSQARHYLHPPGVPAENKDWMRGP